MRPTRTKYYKTGSLSTNGFLMTITNNGRTFDQSRSDAGFLLPQSGRATEALAFNRWSPLYGMLRDRFSVTWVVDMAVPYAPA